MDFQTLRFSSDLEQAIHRIELFPPEKIALGLRPTLSEQVVDEMEQALDLVADHADKDDRLTHVVFSSLAPVFCLGGDLTTLVACRREHKTAELTNYVIKACRFGYRIHGHMHPRVHSVALVEGTAMGGGFEMALGCETLIAQEHTKFGLPEIHFGSFAGVGAYSFLARLVGSTQAGKMLLSGANYSGEQLLSMGVVDHLAPKGQGWMTALGVMGQQKGAAGAFMAHKRLKNTVNPVTLTELEEVAHIWVDTIMGLPENQLQKMEQLIAAQKQRVEK